MYFRNLANYGVSMFIDGWGNVGIGNLNPQAKLDVSGTIEAQDILVTANALPDYVFENEYHNATLAEVAAYIEKNHHLPGMPSAADAAANGVSVGGMQNKLLEKVEELTLHLIEQDKRSGQLEQRNSQLEDENRRLRSELELQARDLQQRIARIEAAVEKR